MNLDPILFWNDVAMEVHRRDFTVDKDGDSLKQGGLAPEHGGPTRTTRALAIVHLAMYSAYEVIDGGLTRYPGIVAPPPPLGDSSAAVAGAAICALSALYSHPAQRQFVVDKGRAYLNAIAEAHEINGVAKPAVSPASSRDGVRTGDRLALQVMALRASDGSEASGWYVPGAGPPLHRADPHDPGQGYLGARWGSVQPFAIASADPALYIDDYPAFGSPPYLADFLEVKAKGVGPNATTSTSTTGATRTADESVIGIFWGYDGARGLGTPPRLYNQCVRAALEQHGVGLGKNNTRDHARLFALVHVGMADAAIVAWGAKYHYNLWRPVLGVREHDAGFGPGHGAGGPGSLVGDPCWCPLGAPQSNTPGAFAKTPPFPAYPSGHATFGALAFRIAELFFGSDLTVDFKSDEFDGRTVDADGSVRTLHVRRLKLSEAAIENSISRVYLGVHWKFDGFADAPVGNKIGGVPVGMQIANQLFASHFRTLAAKTKRK